MHLTYVYKVSLRCWLTANIKVRLSAALANGALLTGVVHQYKSRISIKNNFPLIFYTLYLTLKLTFTTLYFTIRKP